MKRALQDLSSFKEDKLKEARQSVDSRSSSSEWLAVLLVIFGIAIRIALSTFSVGTNDILSWHGFAKAVNQGGVSNLYAIDPLFNHPPLMGWYAALILSLAAEFSLPFPGLFRLPSILAECAILLTLRCVLKSWRATVPYAFGLGSILISSYHGNTDTICVALAFLAAYHAENLRRPFYAGLLLGTAVNIKILPLLLLPAFLLRLAGQTQPAPSSAGATSGRNYGALLHFTGAFSLTLLPFLWAWIEAGDAFLRNALQYSSLREYWGLSLFLLLSQGTYPAYAREIGALYDLFRHYGKYLILLVIAFVILVARRRMTALYQNAALSFALFLILAPGFGIQYLIYVLPFSAAAFPRWAMRLNLLSGVTALALYCHFMVQWDPLYSFHDRTWPKGVVFLGSLAWLGLIAFVFETMRAQSDKP